MLERDCSSSGLSGPEGDDASHRIVRGDSNGHTITRHNLDSEAAHAATQLREHFVARIALDPVQPTRVDCYDSALHVDQIVFAQYLVLPRVARRAYTAPPRRSNQCATSRSLKQTRWFLWKLTEKQRSG